MNRHVTCGLMLTVATVANLQLVAPTHAVLTHRWSFDDVTDSVGGLNLTNNNVTFSDGEAHFNGTDAFFSMASNPLPTAANSNATIEIWGTYDPNTAAGSRIFDISNGSNFYQYFTPRSADNATRWGFDDEFGQEIASVSAGANTGQEVLLTVVIDRAGNMTHVYRDAILVDSAGLLNIDILNVLGAQTNSFLLGHGTSTPVDPNGVAPAFLTGSLSEMRVYDNVLSDLDIFINAITGPDVTSVVLTDKTWNAAGSSSWNTGGNWTAAGVPNDTNRAVIGNGGTATVSAATPAVGAIRITNGTLTIDAGGSLESNGLIEMNSGANSATINVNDGGRLIVRGLLSDDGAGMKAINIDGGTIQAGFRTSIVDPGPVTTVGAGGATYDVPEGTMTWRAELAGSGNIHKTGAGTLAIRPSDAALTTVQQNENFTGEVFVDEGALDIQLTPGVLGSAGSTMGGKVNLNNSDLIVRTQSNAHDLLADLHFTGDDNRVINLVDSSNVDEGSTAAELRVRSSWSGDGTIVYTRPNRMSPLGVDFLNRPNPDPETVDEMPILPVDNSGFTGRIVFDHNVALRFFADYIDPEDPSQGVYDGTDFPNAIFEVTDAFAWVGKRGSSPNQLVRLGGLAGGVAEEFEDETTGETFLQYTRLQAAIAGAGDPLAPVTYRLGGASEDAVWGGTIQNGDGNNETAWVSDVVTIVKMGNNKQTLAGPLTYSGTTTIDGGTLAINGRHSADARSMMGGQPEPSLVPVGDYTVNSGGTLGGSGFIGSAADSVDVHVNGGTINPGESVGDLTVTGNVNFDAASHFAVEISGTEADLLALSGALSITAGSTLDILPLGGVTAGDYTIATFGTRTGEFALNAPAGFSVSYATAGQIILTAPDFGGGLDGDFNGDGVVDAADYTVWRDTGGAPAEFNQWKSNFGAGGGSGSALSASAAVPEPASLLTLLIGVALAGIAARRR